MKRTTRMSRAAWVVLMLPLVAIATTFQNCSKVEFATTADPSKTTSGEKKTMYQEAVVGQANVPPLKLVFVVDNSFTMQANQISLASAFGSMFAGNNASNLAPFDSTAYIFTTAQISLAKNHAAYPLLPTLSYDNMRSMRASDLSSLRGLASAQVDGKFTGDLVSYSVSNLPDPVTMLNRLAYNPTPVLGINSTGSDPISLGAHKEKTGSVGDLSADFSDRISYISPSRTKLDGAGHGLLDPVIDRESGLCALARVLKNNSNFLKKGDLAAFVIVSDEDDGDPSGSACVDAYQDYKDADLIDAHCETPRTKLTFFEANTTTPTCTFNYQKGFTYEVSYPVAQTKVAFSDYYHTNTNAQTTVSYKTASYKYTNYKYDVSYYTSSPTYKLKQVNVSWYVKNAPVCKERDGIKYDCVDSFSPRSAVVEGTLSGSNCSAFSSTYAGAVVGDTAHPIACSQGSPKTGVAGACPTGNANAFDCDPGYAAQTSSYSDDSNAVTCSTLIGKLPAGALKSGVPSNYLPSCAAAVAVSAGSAAVNGFCSGSGKPGCVESYQSNSKKVAVEYQNSVATCQAAIDSASLPSNAFKTQGESNGPTCASSNYADGKATIGKCVQPLPAGIVSCVESQVANSGFTLGRIPAGTSCLSYASSNGLPSTAVPASVQCTDSSTNTTASSVVTYDGSNYNGLVAKVNDACPTALQNSAKTQYGSSATCKITAVNNPTQTYANTCAASAAATQTLCSNAANHGCTSPVDNDSNVNQPWKTTSTSKTVNGTITCSTMCADAYGACGAVVTGAVKDIYHDCSSAADTKINTNSQTGVLTSMKPGLCAAPAMVVVDKSYTSSKTETQFVAGLPSKNNDPNALINYIKARSQELLGTELPATSVFVRQTNGGNGGTEGKAYKALASALGGSVFDVTSPASVYASSLQSLSGVIKDKLDRSFSISGFQPDQVVTQTWYQAAGTANWVLKQEGVDWTASGGTVTISQSMDMRTGDSLRFEYK